MNKEIFWDRNKGRERTHPRRWWVYA